MGGILYRQENPYVDFHGGICIYYKQLKKNCPKTKDNVGNITVQSVSFQNVAKDRRKVDARSVIAYS